MSGKSAAEKRADEAERSAVTVISGVDNLVEQAKDAVKPAKKEKDS